MKKLEAIKLVKETFNGGYTPAAFESFIANVFKKYEPLNKVREGNYIREAFRAFVQKYRIIGTFEDAEGSILDILEVFLQKEGSLERARTAQRNFVSDYLKKQNKDAALVAFISPDQEDWRFSLVKLEYSPEIKDGKLKITEEITPAKRWSFLVGKHEGCHTVQSRFIPILEHGESPILTELEEAFNIESVTDEFFKKYCELFFRMKESLDKLIENDATIKADFAEKDLTSVDFAKKTLGQMAFLYFLQKKGWFGVAPESDWGTGPKDFLRQLFNRREKYGSNFFDDVLEPLFYEALAQDRGVEAIYPRLNNCRMPFLNGGLFEPMNGYSWEMTNIRLPDELFSNKNRTPEGDEGDGILDIFDRYNFTVNENEPLEKEVAVDPEMLGKVFENLLEVKDRKSKATFYTPREIVHYMCQESLINYLDTELNGGVPRQDIETLIQHGSLIIQNDTLVLEKGREGTYKYMLPESIRSKALELDNALAGIKVCDPAVGSGAFPLGMLNEIIQARQALGVHLRNRHSTYDLKLHSISHSIYGVDIDPGAVEIAKLRLWLALVVEETEPHPLPNLEHKIMQGNSLISEYEGVKLFDDNFLEVTNTLVEERANIEQGLSKLQRQYFALHSEGKLTDVKKHELERDIKALTSRKKALSSPNELRGENLTFFDKIGKYQEEQQKTEKLQQKIELFVSESRRSKKQKLKEEIEDLKWELIEASLRTQKKLEKLSVIEILRHKNIRPYFIWKLEFSDVFREKGGFDVIVGNPPYGVSIKGDERKMVLAELGKVPDYEIYYFFVALAKGLLGPKGVKSYIIPNTFLFNVYAAKYRISLLEDWIIHTLLDCTRFKLFDSATVHNAITVFQNTYRKQDYIGYKNTLAVETFLELSRRETLQISKNDLKLNNVNWGLVFKLPQSILSVVSKIRAVGSPLSKKFPNISQGLIAYDKYQGQSEEIIKSRAYHYKEKTKGNLKEWLWGEDVTPYQVKWNHEEYIDYCDGIANPRDPKFFRGERVLVREITNPKIFAGLTDKEQYHDPAIITILAEKEDALALLGILNSKLATFFHFNASPKATKGAFPKILVKDIKDFPLPPWGTIGNLSAVVKEIVEAKQAGLKSRQAILEHTLDEMVYELYRLEEHEKDTLRSIDY